MQELTFSTMIAVFEEVFGFGLFWLMVLVAALITAAYVYVLIRDRQVSWWKFLLAQLSMPIGAVLAVLFVQYITHSSFSDLGGPVDWIVLLLVGIVGAFGMAILTYTVEALVGSKRTRSMESGNDNPA